MHPWARFQENWEQTLDVTDLNHHFEHPEVAVDKTSDPTDRISSAKYATSIRILP